VTVVPPTDCQSTEFRCADNSCIDVSLRCNGLDDCNDGSDELECGTMPLFVNLFDFLSKYKYDTIRHTDI